MSFLALATVAGVVLAAAGSLAQEGTDAPPPPSPWSLGPRLSFPRRDHATTVLIDGSVLMTGGLGTYDSDT